MVQLLAFGTLSNLCRRLDLWNVIELKWRTFELCSAYQWNSWLGTREKSSLLLGCPKFFWPFLFWSGFTWFDIYLVNVVEDNSIFCGLLIKAELYRVMTGSCHSDRDMKKNLALNFKYLLLLCFLTVAEFLKFGASSRYY